MRRELNIVTELCLNKQTRAEFEKIYGERYICVNLARLTFPLLVDDPHPMLPFGHLNLMEIPFIVCKFSLVPPQKHDAVLPQNPSHPKASGEGLLRSVPASDLKLTAI